MRTLFQTTLLVGGLCVLAACNQPGSGNAAANGAAGSGGQASAGGGSAAAPAAGGGQVIDFSAMPRPRAGLWREIVDDGDGAPTTTNTCLSGQVPAVKKPPTCSQFTVTRTLTGGYAMDMNCGSPEYTMVSHAEMSGDWQSHAIGDMTMTITAQGQPPRTIKTHTDMQYLGPCAPGQTPDDVPATNSPG